MAIKRTNLTPAELSAVGGWLPPPFSPGAYYYTTSPQGSSASTLGVGSLRLLPWLVHRTATFDRIGGEVTVVGDAGSRFRIAIYADNGFGLPGNLVLDAGQINGDSVGVQMITISQNLTPGLYWIGGVVQSVTTTQPTIRTIAVGWGPTVPLSAGTSTPGTGLGFAGVGLVASVPGAAPATAGASFNPSGTGPRIFVRVAP